MGIYDNEIRSMEQSMIMISEEFTELYVKNGKILPNDVKELNGHLYLSYNQIEKIENLPPTINGSLFLDSNQIYKMIKLLTNLIKILKDTYIRAILIKHIIHPLKSYLISKTKKPIKTN